MKNKILMCSAMLAIGTLAGCTYITQGVSPDEKRNAETAVSDHFGDSAKEIKYLEQGWDAGDSLWFYNTTQGSDLIPYDIFINLKQRERDELFRSSENMRRFRYLTQKPSMDNPDGLPVGFVKDDFRGKQYMGFTCAACHTTQINYKGTGIRIDGGPALADMDGMLHELEAAMYTTLHDKTKLAALKKAVDSDGTRSAVDFKDDVEDASKRIARYNLINESVNPGGHQLAYGYGRLDAFGRIYNRVLDHVKPNGKPMFNPPNAPVSYPFLWDTPQYDFVQWNGIGNNNSGGGIAGFFGPLGRNTGEVLGVFADFEVVDKTIVVTNLSADKRNLVRLEMHLDDLKSPAWPENILPEIKQDKAAIGKKLFEDYGCKACHTPAGDFTAEQLKHGIVAQFASVEKIGTDKQMASNAIHAMGDTGLLKGKDDPLAGGKYGDTAGVASILTTVTKGAVAAPDNTKLFFIRWAESIHTFVLSFFSNPVTKPTVRHVDFKVDTTGDLYVYKGRSLNGIWATAPYLHNGSVPNLYELFLPACSDAEIGSEKECRSNTFNLGSREYDPVKVGFAQKSKAVYPGLFTFDTSMPGNSNRGHEYAAGITPMLVKDGMGSMSEVTFQPMDKAQREALVEYLKTL